VISILLTLLGWVPGSIHAVWAIVKHEEKVAAAAATDQAIGES
jgi:hypothetical protein